MLHLAGLLDELERSEPARAAMAMLETALAHRSTEEQGAFWRAVDLYYVSRKAPPEAQAAVQAALPDRGRRGAAGLTAARSRAGSRCDRLRLSHPLDVRFRRVVTGTWRAAVTWAAVTWAARFAARSVRKISPFPQGEGPTWRKVSS